MKVYDGLPILPGARVTDSEYERHSVPIGRDNSWLEKSGSRMERQADTRNIIILDPQRLVRQSLKLVLQNWRRADSFRLRVVGDGDDLADALLQTDHQHRVDLAILSVDSEATIHQALEAVRHIQGVYPDARSLLLVAHLSDALLTEVPQYGINGVVSKTASPHVLLLGVETVLRGYVLFPPELINALRRMSDTEAGGLMINSFNGRQRDSPDYNSACSLSQREEQVLRGLINGYSNKRIGRELGIAEATVKVHVKCLLRKMQVENRTQAAIQARDLIHNSHRREDNVVSLQSSKILDAAT